MRGCQWEMCPQHAAQLCGAAIPEKDEQALKPGDQQSTLTDSPHSAVIAQTTCLAGRNRRPIQAKPPDRPWVNQICGIAMGSVARDPGEAGPRAPRVEPHFTQAVIAHYFATATMPPVRRSIARICGSAYLHVFILSLPVHLVENVQLLHPLTVRRDYCLAKARRGYATRRVSFVVKAIRLCCYATAEK